LPPATSNCYSAGMKDVAKLRGLQLRGKTYYSRVVVPGALVPRFGRKEIWKSLGTSKRSEAEALHLKEAAQWAAAFAEVESTPTMQPVAREITPVEASDLARRFFASRKADLDETSISPAELGPNGRETARADLEWQLSTLATWHNPDAHLLVGEAEAAALNGNAPGSANAAGSQVLSELLRRALVQLVAIELARLNGDYTDWVSDSFFGPDTMRAPPPRFGCASVTLGECLDRYKREVLDLRSVTPKTSIKHRALVNHVGDFFGRKTTLDRITRAECNRYRDHLATLPPNFGKRRGDVHSARRKQMAEDRTLSWETQANYLKSMSDVMAWAVREQLVPFNPAEHITPLRKREAAENQRLPFTVEELKTIFSAPLFTGSKDDERSFAIPGPNIIRRSRYWVPLVALYSGMRMGEILQLTPEHVRKSAKGTPFFVLTRDMKLKTGNAEREVPVHPELIRVGFLDWVEEQRQRKSGLLFPDVAISKHGYGSDIFTKRFATFLRSLELPADRRPKLCFHSFRHTFKDALNETGASEEVKDEICGWSRGKKTGRRYGSGLSADLLNDTVRQVTFSLEHLLQT